MRIMLVEDEYLLNKAITTYLSGKGFAVDSFLDGMSALEAIGSQYDVFILDIDLPHLNGIELLEQIHQLYPSLPVIIISATIDMSIVTKAYEKGCSDYLKKPFDIKELALKINVFTRKDERRVKLVDDLYYDQDKQLLEYGKEIITLTKKENIFLGLLISNRTNIVSHDMIEVAVWGVNTDKVYVRQLVNRLRKKVPLDVIENRMGEGYLLH